MNQPSNGTNDVLARAERAYRAVMALPHALGDAVCDLVESQHELAGLMRAASSPGVAAPIQWEMADHVRDKAFVDWRNANSGWEPSSGRCALLGPVGLRGPRRRRRSARPRWRWLRSWMPLTRI
jgi:hypothetical protein